MSSKRISVIIPTYERRDSVKRALQALEEQTFKPDLFEVLVVIDGSRDGTEDVIAKMKTSYCLRVIYQPNRGRAAACNNGIQNAEGELLILLDDDMEPASQFLEAHWHAHQEHKTLGVVGAAPVWIRTGSSTVSVYVAEKFRNHLQKLSQPGYQLNLRDFYSGNFSIRREVLIAVGLFDEEFKLYGNEDLELALRLKKARVSIIFCMEALAHQYYEKDFSALARDSIEKGKTAVLFVRKHPEALSDLKIGTYNEASPRWAFLRALLLKASRVWSGTPKIVVHVVTLLERIRPVRLQLYYQLAIDYFFWLGVKNEQ